MATLHFDSVAAIEAAFASAERKTTAADPGNIAGGDIDSVTFASGEV
jgi:hypothetical protein